MENSFKRKLFYSSVGLLIISFLVCEIDSRGDFYIYISASKDLLAGENIYNIQYSQWFHYYYSVFFALILSPFSFIPFYIINLCWLVLNLFFLYRIWKIISGWLPLAKLNVTSQFYFSVLSFVFVLGFLRDNLHLSQVTIFILYLILEGLLFIDKNKIYSGSLLIALGVDIKLLPVVIIPYLLFRNQWKSVLWILIFVFILLLIPGIYIGYDYNNFLLSERWNLLNPTNNEHILDTSERSLHSLTTLLSTLLIQDSGDWHALPIKRNIASLSIDQLNLVINFVRGFFVLLTLYFLKPGPFKKEGTKLQKLYEISYLCLIIPLIFPHQQSYAFFFSFPASTYLLFYLFNKFFSIESDRSAKHFNFKRISMIVMLSLIYFSENSDLLLGVFTNYFDHFKTLTYGALFMVILLAICKPDKLSKEVQFHHEN